MIASLCAAFGPACADHKNYYIASHEYVVSQELATIATSHRHAMASAAPSSPAAAAAATAAAPPQTAEREGGCVVVKVVAGDGGYRGTEWIVQGLGKFETVTVEDCRLALRQQTGVEAAALLFAGNVLSPVCVTHSPSDTRDPTIGPLPPPPCSHHHHHTDCYTASCKHPER